MLWEFFSYGTVIYHIDVNCFEEYGQQVLSSIIFTLVGELSTLIG